MAVQNISSLTQLLKKHWGYSSFRPRQREIVEAILAGRDAAAVMPTGGGKSLCYQLPALALGRTAVVVSPLIALMQDQAASLRENGISAAFVNSSLDSAGVRDVQRRATQGEFRLVYLSPERALREETLGWLSRLPMSFFAIDEAHCISEWGHEFRPEYRQLRILRDRFPEIPIAAFTASATRQVRHDILAQLNLRDPAKFVMSFHRPNLRYAIRQYAEKELQPLLMAAMERYAEGNVIVYASTIKRVEQTASWLSSKGVPAVPYHGQMGNALRETNQELWMSGEKRVLVGTLAFGLGINNPSVRAVIHLALPKSLEQYYQEAGRAGRDGDPADCVLLWRKQDAGLLVHFIQEIQDPSERERAWRRYRIMRQFAEDSKCRHRQICLHFGETPKWDRCGACDVCGVGLGWTSSGEWTAEPVSAPVPAVPVLRRTYAPFAGALDERLRAALKKWRLDVARAQAVPAYVILHDSTLDALCRQRPRSIADLLEVPGIGERKAERFGERILALLNG
jgi:ATP-dependent DNA helicase RecQ